MQAKNLQLIQNAKNFLVNVFRMVKDVLIKTFNVKTLLSKQNVLKIMLVMFVYGFNNNVSLFHNAQISKNHLILYVNNTQISVLAMV